jgi:ABC-type lipoprotein release transport system permease subunit
VFESADLLVQINGRDPVTIGSIALLLATVSLLASIWPARRATHLDPLVALRRD